MWEIFKGRQKNKQKSQSNINQSVNLKSQSKILSSIQSRNAIEKLPWDIKCENIFNAYLKFNIGESYKHLNRSSIKYIICEFYVLQKKDKTKKKFVGLYETLLENKQLIQIKVPRKIQSGVQFQYILQIVFQSQTYYHIYEVARSHMIKHAEKIPEIQLIQNQDNYQMIEKLKKKVDQIKSSGFKPNILLVGKVGGGKSSFIRHTIKVFKQLLDQTIEMPQPFACQSLTTVTKQFTTHQFTSFGIRFIDTPGYGGQYGLLTSQNSFELYKDIYKISLLGKLNYDQFKVPERISIKSYPMLYMQDYDYDKIIHLVLVFTELNSTPFQIQITKQLINQCFNSQLNHIIIANKIDTLTQFTYSGYTYARILNHFQSLEYNINHQQNIFPLILKTNQLENNQPGKYLYLSMLNKALQIAFDKVKFYTIFLYYHYEQKVIQKKIWKLHEENLKLKFIIKKYINRKLEQIQIKVQDEWKNADSLAICEKNLKNFVKFIPEKKKFGIQLRDKQQT